jgi:hypothetical protein
VPCSRTRRHSNLFCLTTRYKESLIIVKKDKTREKLKDTLAKYVYTKQCNMAPCMLNM